MEVECILCGSKLRRDIANIDAKWESFEIKGKWKYLCRDCTSKIAKRVFDDY